MRQILRNWLFLAVLFIGACCVKAQCPTVEEFIQFNSQAEVNQFLIDYPSCTSIDGRLIIGHNNTSDITDLTPFQNLTSTQGLLIQSTSLTNLNGLQNLSSNDGELSIRYNENLVDLTALSSITTAVSLAVSGNNSLINLNGLHNITDTESLIFTQNNAITNLNGLTSLSTIGAGGVEISFNPALVNLQGLNNLTEIGGGITIKTNAALVSFEGLDGLTEISTEIAAASFFVFMNASLTNIESLSSITSFNGASLNISNNNLLPSLAGLDNVDPESISNLYLQASPNLSACSAPSICSYLDLGRPATISDNSVGCNSVSEVEMFCEVSSDCPAGDVILNTQNQVELFQIMYPDCTNIQGNLYIGTGEGISDIDDLSGLENIENVFGGVTIENTSLINLTGLNSLVQMGDDFVIAGNDLLQNLQALNALISVNASALIINDNDALTSLTGLDNINPASITSLTLSSSQNLSTCDVNSICSYISTFGAVYTISGNATGCNSFEEVLDACQDALPTCPVGGPEFVSQAELDHFLIQYPNCTEINGTLRIGSTSITDISDLQPLKNLTKINGGLTIDKTSLVNLNGLGNLTQTGNLEIVLNNSLESLEGIENLMTVFGRLTIQQNPLLVNLEGLNSVTTVYDLGIQLNQSLINLKGLDNLMAVNLPEGASMFISSNPSLIDLTGLESLQLVNGIVTVNDNESLTSLDGLANFQTIASSITIKNNPSLVSIESLSGLTEVPFLLHINSNPELESLQGLHNITFAQTIDIFVNQSLTNLEGLNSLEMAGNITIHKNQALENLEGLENLNTLTGFLNLNNNIVLNDLQALSNLTHTDQLIIQSNPALTSLEGLDAINPNGLLFLDLTLSQNLSTCSIPSICGYLSNNGSHVISGNATGCNSAEEILELCELSIEEINDANPITLYPVPTKQILNISIQNSAKIESVNVYDMTGKLVLSSNSSESKINLSHLNSGTYLVSVKTNKGIHTEKIIKK